MSFFGGMPFPVQFFLAFVIVLGLIGATAWAVRRFGSGRLGGAGLRGRQPRLAVVDYASVDARRRLILIRRDNVEHLVMIGGPTDIVVESSIVRASATARDVAAVRPPAIAPEPAPRAIALPDGTGNGSWTPPPEPAVTPPPRNPRADVAPEPPAFPLQPPAEAAARPPQRDTLVALADELSSRPGNPVRNRPPANARVAEARQEARPEPRPEARIAAPQPANADSTLAADQSLAEMAHRLEAALRKPAAKPERTEPRIAPTPRAAAPTEHAAPAEAAEAAPGSPAAPAQAARTLRAVEVRPPRADGKQTNPGKALYDSLEQEMASLLGRPTAKNSN